LMIITTYRIKVFLNSRVEELETNVWMDFHAKALNSHQSQAYFNDMLMSLVFQLVFLGLILTFIKIATSSLSTM
jgi:hypothetical protein